jgi:ribonuclease D
LGCDAGGNAAAARPGRLATQPGGYSKPDCRQNGKRAMHLWSPEHPLGLQVLPGRTAFPMPRWCGINGASGPCAASCRQGAKMTVRLHRGDLPDLSRYGREVAIDTETMGLDPRRDRLCVVQLSPGDGSADVVQIPADLERAPNLERLLADPDVTKIFHYARFDMAVLKHRFGVVTGPVYCTKIASKLVRTYTDRHGLKDLARELLSVDLSKQQQSSDWGADKITDAQLEYAASDVLYLHDLKRHLDRMLRREGREELAATCFGFLPTRITLDLLGWDETDIFAHS